MSSIGCGLVTRPDGSKYAVAVGETAGSEILDLQTMELRTVAYEGRAPCHFVASQGA